MPSEGTHTGSSRTIQSLEKSLDILDTLHRNGGATLAELDAELPYSKSVIHHHLCTFRQRNFVEQDGTQYRIGYRFLTYGGSVLENERLYQIAREKVDRLAAETGEVARLVVEMDGKGMTLYQSMGENVGESFTTLGNTEYLHCTAAGKAFLANLSIERTNEILDEHGLPRYTEHTITDRDVLFDELKRIRETGIAFDDREQFETLRCAAVPVFNDKEDLLGAISISLPVGVGGEEEFRADLAQQLQNVAGVVHYNVIWSDWD